MNAEVLCPAVWEAPDWLARFTRHGYAGAFEAYTARFGPLYAQAVAECGGDPAALCALAQALLDALEAAWQRQRPWRRSGVRVNEKQVIVNFLSPMLLEQSDPQCAAFARELRRSWEARWPRDVYHVTSYATLKGGFRNAIMGIDLNNRHLRGDGETYED